MAESLPRWAKGFFSLEKKAQVERKIAEVESTTRGEVVVVIANSSSTVGHVPFAIFASLLFIFTLVDLPHIQASFSGEIWWPLLFWPVVCLLLTRWLSGFPFIQRLFLPLEDRQHQVELRAETEFYRQGLQKTDNSTGVLIFVSLLEHQAVILGDKGISKKLSAETWTHILKDLQSEAKKGQLTEGLLKALEDIRPILKEHFPIETQKNPNELPNHLIFVDF